MFRTHGILVPEPNRKHVEGTEPRSLTWRKVFAEEILAIVLDIKYTVVDPGISNGENFEGIIRQFMSRIAKGNSFVPILAAQRDAMRALAHLLWDSYQGPENINSFLTLGGGNGVTLVEQKLVFSDDTPTTSVQQHAYYCFLGPFEPGEIVTTLDLLAITSEFGGATNFTADIGLSYVKALKPTGCKRVAAAAKRAPSETEVYIKATNGVYIDTTTDLDSIVHDLNHRIADAELDQYIDWHNMSRGVPWNNTGAKPGDLTMVLDKVAPLKIVYNATKTFSYAFLKYSKVGVSMQSKKPLRSIPAQKKIQVNKETFEITEVEE